MTPRDTNRSRKTPRSAGTGASGSGDGPSSPGGHDHDNDSASDGEAHARTVHEFSLLRQCRIRKACVYFELLIKMFRPNVTGNTKERIAQSKRARAGLLAIVD